jgi:hypothetical protein
MSRDLDEILRGWEYKPDVVQARLVRAGDRQVLQLRIELGLLQMEISARPDGRRPHGHLTYLDYLRSLAQRAACAGKRFVMNEQHRREADREFGQYYHRRISWLALRSYTRAIADAEHTLALMDFVRDHCDEDDYIATHEQYRGFVLFHKTQALAARATENNRPDEALGHVRNGLEWLRAFFASYGVEDRMDEDGMVQQLRRMERALLALNESNLSLEQQLAMAIAREEYERAAQLRDAIRRQS